jgi:hypothetical protein
MNWIALRSALLVKPQIRFVMSATTKVFQGPPSTCMPPALIVAAGGGAYGCSGIDSRCSAMISCVSLALNSNCWASSRLSKAAKGQRFLEYSCRVSRIFLLGSSHGCKIAPCFCN